MMLVFILLLSLAPTAAPQNVGGVATNSTSLRLYWSPPPYQHQTGRIQYYHVSIRNVITDAVVRSITTINTQLTVSSLHPYSTYRCTVAAVTVAQGPQSIPIMIQTYQDGKFLYKVIKVQSSQTVEGGLNIMQQFLMATSV